MTKLFKFLTLFLLLSASTIGFAQDCSITEIITEAHPCNDDGFFYVDIEVHVSNPGTQGFSVLGNGHDYGDFSYDDTFITIGPLDGDGTTAYEFVIIDNQFEACTDFVDFGTVDCSPPDCGFTDISMNFEGCNDDGFYFYALNFHPQNVQNEFFDLFINGEFFGFHAYADLPVTLDHVGIYDTEFFTIQICDNDNPDCCTSLDVETPVCPNPTDCSIDEIIVEAHDCNDDGFFFVDIEVHTSNPGTQGFSVHGNGHDYGDFSYDDTFITIGPLDGDGTTHYEFVITDNQFNDCSNFVEFGTIDCSPGDCGFNDIAFNFEGCNDDGQYIFALNFHPQNVQNEYFNLYINEEFVDFYPYAELPVILYHVGPFDTETFLVQICDNDNPDCCTSFDVETPECETSTDCSIDEIVYEIHDCNDDGFFYVDIEVHASNSGTQGFSVVGNGHDYGDFSYDDTFITIGPLEGDGTTTYEFIIIDNQFEECTNFIGLEPIDCSPGDCGFNDISFNFEGCNDDGQYIFALNFHPQNVQNEYFNLYINEEFVDFYPYAELPVILYHVGPFDTETFLVQICDNDNPDCCTSFDVETPECETSTDCSIDEIVYELHDCNDDGFFYIDIEVHASNTGTQGFSVVGNGHDYGDFSYDDTFITIGPLEGDGTTTYEFIIIDNQFEECTNFIGLEPINCSPGDCGFNDISFNFEGCNDDGQYVFALNFHPQNVQNEYFDVFINEEFYGFFAYAELPAILYHVGPFDTETFLVQICDNDNPDCCTSFDVETPECELSEDCTIADIIIEPHGDCEGGQFWVDLAFESQNTGALGYYVFANGDIFGPFDYSDAPITLGPFEGDGETDYDFLILDIANPACFGYHEFGTFDCEEEAVWPGDTNTDNISNHFDLLNIGIAFGEEGENRMDFSTEWAAQDAANWDFWFSNNSNYKHADCDGNGIIETTDIDAILENYNETHGVVQDFIPQIGTLIDPPVFLDIPDDINPGASFEIPIILGTEDIVMHDIYGIAFSIELDPSIIDISSLSIEFPTGWMGEPGINLITLDHFDANTNILQIAISRKDHNNVSGYGPVVIMRGIIDDIAGIQESEMHVEKVKAIDFEQVQIPIHNPTSALVISEVSNTKPNFVNLLRNTWIYPNPASESIRILNRNNVSIDKIEVFNMAGKKINTILQIEDKISVEQLPAGIYTLKLSIGGYIINKKLVKVQK